MRVRGGETGAFGPLGKACEGIRFTRIGAPLVPDPRLSLFGSEGGFFRMLDVAHAMFVEAAELECRNEHAVVPGLLVQSDGSRQIESRARRFQQQHAKIDGCRPVVGRNGLLEIPPGRAKIADAHLGPPMLIRGARIGAGAFFLLFACLVRNFRHIGEHHA